MKKKVITMLAMLICATSMFAQRGFELGLVLPLGASISFPDYSIRTPDAANSKYLDLKEGIGFEWGGILQSGYVFALSDGISLSILLDMGYHRDVIAYSQITTANEELGRAFIFETVQFGLLPKINVGAVSIGIGGGIKVPLSYLQYAEMSNTTSAPTTDTDKVISFDKNGKIPFETNFIPYINITFDYFFPLDSNLAIGFGAYIGYDFLLTSDSDIQNPDDTSLNSDYTEAVAFSALDVGLRFSLKYIL